MKAISLQMRVTSLLLAVLTSAAVLSATAAGMQASGASTHAVVALERTAIVPTAVR